ncbi:MAG: hypothetical protein N2Z22_00105 [Turneriella sp.]|nr:hypothetical protein [Turneriella sp.]
MAQSVRPGEKHVPEEPPLDVRQMALILFNAMVFIKIPLLVFGFRMAHDPTPFNVAGFVFFIAVALFSLIWFVVRKKPAQQGKNGKLNP